MRSRVPSHCRPLLGVSTKTLGAPPGRPLGTAFLFLRLGWEYCPPAARITLSSLLKRLDLDIDASRQIELHQRIHRLLGRFENIDQPLVRADLEGLARLLVHVRRTQHAILVLDRRQGNRAGYRCSGALEIG